MGRRSNIDKLPPELNSTVVDCIRAHRHYTLDELMSALEELGVCQISRSALHRFLPTLDQRDALCANPNEGTIVTIVERGTGEVRMVKSSASGQAIHSLIASL